MIYLDPAATSLQKPNTVAPAMLSAMKRCASPGRGSYAAAMLAADTALDCRTELAALFNMPGPENIVFTLNATHALNIAIHSLVKPGDSVVISGYEHNSVTRPLHALGADIRVAASPLFDQDAAVEAFRRSLGGCSCAVCTHVSNVFGFVLPIERIAALCAGYEVPLIIDASQSAGSLDIDFQALGAAFIAMPGHKGLLGPQGTGVLLCADGIAKPLLYGGTGSLSAQPDMPDFLPDMLEAGTHNITGIAGLLAGVRYVRRTTLGRIISHERELRSRLARELAAYPGVRVFETPDDAPQSQAGVLSVTTDAMSCEELAERLGGAGVAIRSGLHCAPSAHRTAGTIDTGTARFSFSPFNTRREISAASVIFGRVLQKNG